MIPALVWFIFFSLGDKHSPVLDESYIGVYLLQAAVIQQNCVRSSATLSCRGQGWQCSLVDCWEHSWSEMLNNIPEKKRPRAQINSTSACSSGAAHFIPQFLVLILTFWFSADEEFLGVTGDSLNSEDISLTSSDSVSVVVSSEWHTSLHFTAKLVFSSAARLVFWHPNVQSDSQGWNTALTYLL